MYEKEIAIWKLIRIKTARLRLIFTLKAFYWKKFIAPGCVWRTVDGRMVVVAKGPGVSRWHKATRKLNDKVIVVPARQKPVPVKIKEELLERPRLAFFHIPVPALINDNLAFLDLASCEILSLSELCIFKGRLLPDELDRIERLLVKNASSKVSLRWFYEL